MLKAPDHQVAGHFAIDGQLGPLIDGSGLFFKPLQSSSRGSTELSFYTSFSSDPRIPPSLRHRFFPSFHGTRLLPHPSGGPHHPHLILQDLTSDLSSPSIIDFKIGSRTWSPLDPEPYFQKCIKKDRETTSLTLGFRVSGLQMLDGSSLARPDRDEVRKYTVEDVRRVVGRFAGVLPVKEAERVVGMMRELKEWFEKQTIWHFYSASVMVMYEQGKGEARVKVVDFAHVVEGNGVIDHNFLGGLCSLIRFVEEAIEGLVGEERKENGKA